MNMFVGLIVFFLLTLTISSTHCFFTLTLHARLSNTMHSRGFDNLSREIFDSKFVLEINDNCDYEEDIEGYSWNDEDFIVLNINIRGLYSKQTNLKNLIDDVESRGKAPSVITVSETWLTPHSPVPEIAGYKLYRRDRLHKKGGGIAIFVSERLQSREVAVDIPTPTAFEYIAVEIKGRRDPVIICSIYRPPNTIIKTFLTEYNKLLNRLRRITIEVIIGLDHNMDFLRSDKHKETNEFIELMLSHQQVPTITRPTRIARHSATLIDNIIVNQRHCENYISLILINDMSDHLPCLTVLKNVVPYKNEKVKFKSRSLKGLGRLKEELAVMDWSALENEADVDIQTEFLQNKMRKLLDAHCPETELTISSKTLRREPWLTKGLMTSCKKSRDLYKKTLDPTTNNCLSVLKYKQYSNTLTRLKQYAKVAYYQAKCAEFRHNTKNLWKLINKITGKVNNKCEVIDCIRVDKVRCYSSQLIANEFGEFFANIGRTYANRIPKSKQNPHYYLGKIPRQERSIYLSPTTAVEISKLICKLPNKSSSGYDKINNILLKKLNKELSDPIAMICNNLLKSGIFPTQMKTAIVVPLYKSKGCDYVNNYRPISLLMTISKLLEKVIYSRVYGFLTETKQIYDSQYGFCSGHSCENAISEVLGEIVKALQNGKTTVCILLDLSKAFDSLEHEMILKKMDRYGLRGVCLQWFESYLHGRHIQVKCKTGQSAETYSDLYDVDYGTPQGSCLGPLIFLLFCNDLRLHLDYLKGIQFADDSTLLKSHSNLRYLNFCIEHDLELIQDWFNANKLTLNVDKTVCMVFSPKNSNTEMKINLSGVELPVVPVSKFLGLWIDSKLNWNEHLRRLITRLYSRLGLLKRK